MRGMWDSEALHSQQLNRFGCCGCAQVDFEGGEGQGAAKGKLKTGGVVDGQAVLVGEGEGS